MLTSEIPSVSEQDLLHPLGHRPRPVHGRAFGELQLDEEGALVLARQEAGRGGPERLHQPEHDGGEQDEPDHGTADQELDHGRIAVARLVDAGHHVAHRSPLGAVRRLQQDGTEGGGQGQGVQRRDQHRDRHGHRELLVELAADPWNERHRHEDREQDECDGDDRCRDLRHRELGRLGWREPGIMLQLGLDRLDHDDGVIHHDADREHESQQRDRVGGETQSQHHGEGADERDRHRDQRDQRRPDVAEEEEDHDHHEDEGLAQGLDHLVDALLDEPGGVVGDLVGKLAGEAPGEPLQLGPHPFRDADGVGTRCLIDGDQGTRLAVVAAERIGCPRPQLDPGHVPDPDEGAIRVGADDHVLELGGVGQPPLGLDVELELLVVADRLRADPSGRGLDVLRLQGRDDVVRGHAEAGQPVGLEPDPHAVLEPAEQEGVTDAAHPLDVVEDVDRRVVRQEQRVVGLGRRIEIDDLEECRGLLLDTDAGTLDLVRQLGLGEADPVLDVDRVGVGIGADGEGDDERVAAVIAARRLHVEHVVDAHDLGFDRLGHGLLDHAGRRHRDRWR